MSGISTSDPTRPREVKSRGHAISRGLGRHAKEVMFLPAALLLRARTVLDRFRTLFYTPSRRSDGSIERTADLPTGTPKMGRGFPSSRKEYDDIHGNRA